MNAKGKALGKAQVEYRGNMKVTHKKFVTHGEHTYEPTSEQHKKNKILRKEKSKKFGTNY